MTRGLLTGLHAFLAVGAVGAGYGFVCDPSGAAVGMDAAWLSGSPFEDYRVPGLFLGFVIGGANLASAFLLARRHPFGPRVSLATGLLLVVWLAIQTAILGVRHWSQAIWWVLFPSVALLAARLARGR
ncbi:MAG: hypothetical protein AMXMBFR23_11120 [Chloroflexota bacterium]